jgi:DNA polymerase-3 subunit alpha
VPLVVVNDSHHAFPEQWMNKELVWALNTSNNDSDKLEASVEKMAQKADHIMGEEELHYWMAKHGISAEVVDQAIANSHELAQKCQVEIKPTLEMPRLAKDEVEDLKDLIAACEQGFKQFVTDEGLDEAKYYARLQEELQLISSKNFAGYFNMVRDYTMAYRSGSWAQYVHKNAPKDPQLIGPGRGSVGGTLVGYLTGIDGIDPIKYGTLFSRFLSPGRKGFPDIDVDVSQKNRPDLLKYLFKRFGEDNACIIGTLSHNGPKSTIKDVGRALGITKLPGGYTDLQAISDHIEEVVHWQKQMRADDVDADEDISWEDLIEKKGGALLPYKQRYPELFSKVEEMVGLVRHSGVHAAGVLVSNKPLLGAIPLRRTKNKVITTQFDMWEVEELGGVKLDLLGIRHLDTLSVARKLIYDRHGVWIDYDRTGLSVPQGCDNVIKFGDEHFNDPAIWPQIDKGHTTGIFQVETSNCTTSAIDFRPRSMVDIANLTSIIRPGVADAGLKDAYVRRRAGLEPVLYDHPLMESFVGPKWSTDTFGILVYQEQIIQCVQDLAGFTPDEADGLRKAMGKKQMDVLLKYKSKFVQGCLDNPAFSSAGNPERIADAIWASIEASGRYAFNWSHAIGYAMISTWEIWTKHYYPQEFLVALMQTDGKHINKYIREARRGNIVILPPDVNLSARKFTIDGDKIRYGLDTVRSVGEAACNGILKARPFTTIEDYLRRAGKGADKQKVYNLICIGAFDSIGDKYDLLDQLEYYRATEDLAPSTLAKEDKLNKVLQRRLANPDYQITRPDFTDPRVVYEMEKELVGNYVTVDPMERYVPLLDAKAIKEATDISGFPVGNRFCIGGQLVGVKTTVTKKGRNPGQEMAHLTVQWNEEDFRITVWPQQWASAKMLLDIGSPVAIEVRRLNSGCCLESLERLDILYDRAGIA